MASTSESQTLAKRQWIVASIAFVLTSLFAMGIFAAERRLNGAPGWGEVVVCGICLGVISALLDNYGGWRTFSECMHVSLMPIAVLFIVLGFLLLLSTFAALALGGIVSMVVTLWAFVYFGILLSFPMVIVVLVAASCSGGAFVYAVLQLMRFRGETRGPQWQ